MRICDPNAANLMVISRIELSNLKKHLNEKTDFAEYFRCTHVYLPWLGLENGYPFLASCPNSYMTTKEALAYLKKELPDHVQILIGFESDNSDEYLIHYEKFITNESCFDDLDEYCLSIGVSGWALDLSSTFTLTEAWSSRLVRQKMKFEYIDRVLYLPSEYIALKYGYGQKVIEELQFASTALVIKWNATFSANICFKEMIKKQSISFMQSLIDEFKLKKVLFELETVMWQLQENQLIQVISRKYLFEILENGYCEDLGRRFFLKLEEDDNSSYYSLKQKKMKFLMDSPTILSKKINFVLENHCQGFVIGDQMEDVSLLNQNNLLKQIYSRFEPLGFSN